LAQVTSFVNLIPIGEYVQRHDAADKVDGDPVSNPVECG